MCVMGSGQDQRNFDRGFKDEAIRLMNEGKRSVSEIAKDLDIHPNMLHQSRRKYRPEMEQAIPEMRHGRPPKGEVQRSPAAQPFRMGRMSTEGRAEAGLLRMTSESS